jgi:uncharacterized protein with HEPN domain
MNPDHAQLIAIQHAAEQVREIAQAHDRASFALDAEAQASALEHLRAIGTAVERLSPDYRLANPEVPWAAMAALAGQFFTSGAFDPGRAWTTVHDDMPLLLVLIEMLLIESED